jgi:hypothetical protein
MRYLIAAASVCLVWHASSALAYSCNNNHYVNSSGHAVHSPSCGEEPEKRRNAAMAVSAFQSTIVGRARITVASPTGIEPARMAGFLFHTIGACLRRRP